EWPVTNSISPAATAKLTPDRAAWPPGYCLLTLSKRRTVIAGGRAGEPPVSPLPRAATSAAGAPRRLAASVLAARRPRHQRLQAAPDPAEQRGLVAARIGGRLRRRRGLPRRAVRGLLGACGFAALERTAATTTPALAR